VVFRAWNNNVIKVPLSSLLWAAPLAPTQYALVDIPVSYLPEEAQETLRLEISLNELESLFIELEHESLHQFEVMSLGL
jgi:hypothetical protein